MTVQTSYGTFLNVMGPKRVSGNDNRISDPWTAYWDDEADCAKLVRGLPPPSKDTSQHVCNSLAYSPQDKASNLPCEQVEC